ncbi:MAG: host attachment family protein [Azospirillaceae bacterium]
MKAPTTWILIADGGRAKVMRHTAAGQGLSPVPGLVFENDNPPDREQGTDRPGRLDDAGVGRSAVQETDWHEIAKTRFAGQVAKTMEKHLQKGAFDRLVVIAPPKVLGDLRQQFNHLVADKLVADIPKDLTKSTDDVIAKAVDGVLYV